MLVFIAATSLGNPIDDIAEQAAHSLDNEWYAPIGLANAKYAVE